MPSTVRTRSEALRDFGLRASQTAQERVPGAVAVVESLEREHAAGSGLLAGGIAYRFFLWLVPFGGLMAALGSFWAQEDPDGFADAAGGLGLAGSAVRTARTTLTEETPSRWYLLALGVVLVVWFGTSAVRALRVAHQIAWAVQAPKVKRPISASLLFTAFAAGGTAVGILVRWLREDRDPLVWLLLSVALFFAYLALALAAMSLLPHADAPWQALVPGAAIVAFGTQLVHLFVVVYLMPKLTRSSQLYGSLGGATVVLLWLYVSARLIVSSAFLNATLWERRHRHA